MNYYLKQYKIILHAIGPVFIGDGKQLVKNEYVLDKRKGIAYIIDQRKLFHYLRTEKLVDNYEDSILKASKNLRSWLYDQKLYKDVQDFAAYTLDCDNISELNTMKNILTFQRDAYGLPYVPGSSLKGAIRTVLLGADIIANQGKYTDIKKQIRTAEFKKRASYLKQETERAESLFFHTKEKKKVRRGDAVNDSMSGVRISDSKPLSLSDLALCQKIDMHVDGREKGFPILRECLKPSTRIEFDLTIDNSDCPFKPKDILESVDVFLASYNKLFLEKFKEEELYTNRVIYLGGGSGFATKTVLHQLLDGERDRVKTVSTVIDNTLSWKSKNAHKHYKDVEYGVSPHTCKLTEYDRGLYQMGACRIEIT